MSRVPRIVCDHIEATSCSVYVENCRVENAPKGTKKIMIFGMRHKDKYDDGLDLTRFRKYHGGEIYSELSGERIKDGFIKIRPGQTINLFRMDHLVTLRTGKKAGKKQPSSIGVYEQYSIVATFLDQSGQNIKFLDQSGRKTDQVLYSFMPFNCKKGNQKRKNSEVKNLSMRRSKRARTIKKTFDESESESESENETENESENESESESMKGEVTWDQLEEEHKELSQQLEKAQRELAESKHKRKKFVKTQIGPQFKNCLEIMMTTEITEQDLKEIGITKKPLNRFLALMSE